MIKLQVFSLLLLYMGSLANLSAEYSNTASLDGNNFKVYWTHNATSNMMYIALEVKATGWVTLAFAKEKSSSMKDYDACLGYVSGGTKVLNDYLTKSRNSPPEDSHNDCMLDEAMLNGGTTTIKYHRKVNTGDSQDIVIEKGEIIVVWAYRNAVTSLSRHDKKGFETLTMISSGKAAKLKSFYWKITVASLSVVVALFFK
ncbi:uncharacterized protein LOC111332266 [Stylophora pistillata]|uniref:DBH-like monooxygenase protein 1 n=1 Tax=Stylophora pistillata TaxID=50429 RepID=A0A2B4STH8_STYPI|nr:uncharacterized protein LOC111332266 [Stylophora pistillata]PFX33984.1 DBH-like monooxygenase protein 1 [Stylophora pistillata]